MPHGSDSRPTAAWQEEGAHLPRMDMDSRKTLEQIRQWLDGRDGHWTIWVRLAGRPRPWRVPWPEDRCGREEAWRTIEGVLLASQSDGEIRGRQVGAPRSRTTVIPWPGPVDLFTGTEPAEPTPAREVSQDATGTVQARAVELPGLSVRLISLDQPPRKANAACARAICRILYDLQKRHTAGDLVIELQNSETDYCWSQATIEASAGWLRSQGAIDNRRDGYGVGYGLLDWNVNPIGE